MKIKIIIILTSVFIASSSSAQKISCKEFDDYILTCELIHAQDYGNRYVINKVLALYQFLNNWVKTG
jgi:hypothetical protein